MDNNEKKVLDDLIEAFSSDESGRYTYMLDLNRHIMQWPKSAVSFFGLSSETLPDDGKEWVARIHPDDRKAYLTRIEPGVVNQSRLRYRVQEGNGSYVTCDETGNVVFDDNGRPQFIAGTLNNYGVQSRTDTVTGLPNLYAFFNDLKEERENSTAGLKGCVLLIGSSRFSEVNDIYGYSFGNQVLLAFTELLHAIFKGCLIYRMEGVKFVIRSLENDEEELTKLYEVLRQKVKNGINVAETRIHLFLSGGIMNLTAQRANSHTIYSCLLFAYADSKNHHQGELIPFKNKLSSQSKEWLEELNIIRESVIDGCSGFFICYQPIVRVRDGKLNGAEALIRWQHKDYGIVTPEEFIPILEKDAVFPDLGSFILRQALREVRPFLKDNPDFFINVNLSYAQIERSNFADVVMSIVREEHFPPTNVCLELTERCRIMDEDMLISKVNELKAQGIKFALDDFGTGFSSLNLMRKLPIDEIKIDRQFIKNILNNRVDQNIINALTHMVTDSGKTICIEGIENEELQQFLQKYPVSYFQGYLYSKPVPIEDFKKLELDSRRKTFVKKKLTETERLEISERTNTVIIQGARILQGGGSFHDNMGHILSVLAEVTHPDAIYLGNYNNDRYDVYQKWLSPGVDIALRNVNEIPLTLARWSVTHTDEDGYISIPHFKEIEQPLNTAFDKRDFSHIKSLMVQTLRDGDKITGVLVIANYKVDESYDVNNLIKAVSFFISSEMRNAKLIKQLTDFSRNDQLAGCLNRNAFEEDSVELKREHEPLGIIFADLNGLKLTNDTQGHTKGDMLIIRAKETLAGIFSSGTLYRIGGDEFLVTFTNYANERDFLSVMNEKVKALDSDTVNISIGWAFTPDSGELERTQLSAERMMYRNKAEYYKVHDRRHA